MKLLYCRDCGDLFNLDLFEKSCRCGATRGQYVDNLNAVYTDGIPLGFANTSFIHAVKNQPAEGLGEVFTAFVIPVSCPTFKQDLTWSSEELPPTSTPPSSTTSQKTTSRTTLKRSEKR